MHKEFGERISPPYISTSGPQSNARIATDNLRVRARALHKNAHLPGNLLTSEMTWILVDVITYKRYVKRVPRNEINNKQLFRYVYCSARTRPNIIQTDSRIYAIFPLKTRTTTFNRTNVFPFNACRVVTTKRRRRARVVVVLLLSSSSFLSTILFYSKRI